MPGHGGSGGGHGGSSGHGGHGGNFGHGGHSGGLRRGGGRNWHTRSLTRNIYPASNWQYNPSFTDWGSYGGYGYPYSYGYPVFYPLYAGQTCDPNYFNCDPAATQFGFQQYY